MKDHDDENNTVKETLKTKLLGSLPAIYIGCFQRFWFEVLLSRNPGSRRHTLQNLLGSTCFFSKLSRGP